MQHSPVSRWRSLPGVLIISVVVLMSALTYHQVLDHKEPNRIPIDRPFPKYPIQAAIHKTEGFVRVAFDVTKEGHTSNVLVLESQPADIFDEMALAAVKTWRYKAAEAASFDHKVQLDFILSPEERKKGHEE